MKNKYWIIFFSSIFLLSILSIILIAGIKPDKKLAEIYHDGELIQTIDLSSLTEDMEIPLEFNKEINTVLAQKDKISIKHASCPDKLCVKQGSITNGAFPIVCLPNKIIIKIVDGKNNYIDAISK